MSLFSRSKKKKSKKKQRQESVAPPDVQQDGLGHGGQALQDVQDDDQAWIDELEQLLLSDDLPPAPWELPPDGGDGGEAEQEGSSGKRKKKKRRKRGFRKGTELTEHRGGTTDAHQDFRRLMHQTDGERVSDIVELLTGRKKSKNQVFYHLQARLSGDNGGLEMAYFAATRQRLREDLRDRVSVEQYEYLRNVLMHGEPLLEDRIKLAMGLLTSTSSDSGEVLHLFEEEADDQEKLRIWNNLEPLLRNKLKDKVVRVEAQVDTLRAKEALSPEQKEDLELGVEPRSMLEAYDKELVAMAQTCVGKLGLKRDKLAEILPDWAATHSWTARQWVVRPESEFYAFLKKRRKDKLGRVFKKEDMTYVLAMIRDAQPVDASFIAEDVDEEELSEKGLGKLRKAQREEGAERAELQAYMERKEHTDAFWKGTDHFETFVEKVEDMSDDQKEALLLDYMSDEDRAAYEDPETSHHRRLEIREAALHDGLRMQLKRMGLRGNISGLTALRKRVVAAFAYGAAGNTTNEFSTYQRLVTLSQGHKIDRKKFGKDALKLVRKLRGDEFAQVRGDSELMRRIRKKAPSKYVTRIQLALGMQTGRQDDTQGTASHDPLNREGRDGQAEHGAGDARSLAAEEAELQPSHWAMLITSTAKDSRLKRRTEINSMVTRAYMAGRRRERMTATGPARLSGSLQLSPMTAQEFVQAVDAQISKGARKEMKRRNMTVALEALEQGTRPSVDDQIDDAKFRNAMKRTRGARFNADRIERMVEDLDGRDLLEEWSNIDELRALGRARDQARGAERRELQRDLDRFVLGIREDRQRYLDQHLPPADLVDVVGTVQSKLADAMASDPEVVEILHAEGFHNDEISQSETASLALLDEQKQRSTGAQYNSYRGPSPKNPTNGKAIIGASSKSAQTKEASSTLLGRTRQAESELRQGGDRDQVVNDRAKGIQDAQKDLKRLGKAFDEMQKKYNAVAKKVIKAFLRAVVVAAVGAATALTGGLGGIVAVAIGGAKTLLMESLMQVAKAQLEGDAHNTTEAVWDVAFKTFAAVAGGAASEIFTPMLADAAQLPTYVEGGGGVLDSTHIGHAPGSGGQMSLVQEIQATAIGSLKKGTKKLVLIGINELRENDDRANRGLRVGAELGGLALSVGGKIGKTAASGWEEDASQRHSPVESRVAGGLAKSSKYVSKALAKELKALAKPDKTTHGSDRDQGLATLVAPTVTQAIERIEGIDELLADEDTADETRRELRAERMGLEVALETLDQAWAAWQEQATRDTYADSEDLEASRAAGPVVAALMDLRDQLGLGMGL